MWGYVGRRLLAFIPTVFVAVTLIFILTRLVPGNPVWALLGHQSVSAEQIDAVAREMGLDRPILIQYLERLSTALYVTVRNEEASIESRAKRIHELKPHVSVELATDAVKELDASSILPDLHRSSP